MLELPETITIGKQMDQSLKGKTILRVLPPTKPHKFTWFGGDPADYDARMRGSRVVSGQGFGSNAELALDNGLFLSFSDGASPRLYDSVSDAPKKLSAVDRVFGRVRRSRSASQCTAASYCMTARMITRIIRRAAIRFSPFSQHIPGAFSRCTRRKQTYT